jgi:hypothetical protein
MTGDTSGTHIYKPSRVEEVARHTVVDAKLLRRALANHDFTDKERFGLLIAAIPALLLIEDAEDE